MCHCPMLFPAAVHAASSAVKGLGQQALCHSISHSNNSVGRTMQVNNLQVVLQTCDHWLLVAADCVSTLALAAATSCEIH